MSLGKFSLFAVVLASASMAGAAPIAVTSYDMPNGNGQASGGSYNYWDLSYSGAGAKTTDGAALSGGTGDLTDGVVASNFWFNVENGAGTGPYVGWYAPATPNPVITFNFGGAPVITGIDIHVDNSWQGGVYAPASILVDGVAQLFTVPAPGSIGTISLTGLNLTGNSHTIQFGQAFGGWTFVSEISFFGETGAVPEPASWAMMIAGFGLAGAAMRRRSAKAAFA